MLAWLEKMFLVRNSKYFGIQYILKNANNILQVLCTNFHLHLLSKSEVQNQHLLDYVDEKTLKLYLLRNHNLYTVVFCMNEFYPQVQCKFTIETLRVFISFIICKDLKKIAS